MFGALLKALTSTVAKRGAVKTGGQGVTGYLERQAASRPRINLLEQGTLRDLADYRAGAWKPDNSQINMLMNDARAVGQKHGADFSTGSMEEQLERANRLLNMVGRKY